MALGLFSAARAGAAPVGVPPSGVGGQIAVWGSNGSLPFAPPASLTGKTATAIAAGGQHALALTSDGTVTAWGHDVSGQIDVPAALTGKTVTAIAAGGDHSLALTSDGEVTAWGDNFDGESNVPPSLATTTVTAIAAGSDSSMALTRRGLVVTWGGFTPVPVPDAVLHARITAIAAGGGPNKLALSGSGTLFAWGDRSGINTVPGSLTGKSVVAIAIGDGQDLALTSDGAVTEWDAAGPIDVPASLTGKTVTAIAGSIFYLALTSDGQVTAWGDDERGQTDLPPGLATANVTAISAANTFAMAITPTPGDYVPPEVATDATIAAQPTTIEGRVINYPVPAAVDNVDGPLPVTCTPPPGSVFPRGGTDVVCRATDSAGNTGRSDSIIFVRNISINAGITGVSRKSGSVTGGTTVTLTGYGLGHTTSVRFGSTPAPRFTIDSDTQITAVTPPGVAGFVHVCVRGHLANSGASPLNRFHYLPDVTSITPASGSSAGGTSVTIAGDGFSVVQAVLFGTTPATFTVISPTSITATAPALAAGDYDVTVRVQGGATPAVAADRYTALP